MLSLSFPPDFEVTGIRAIRKFIFNSGPEIVRYRSGKWRATVQDYQINVVFTNRIQRMLRSLGRVFVKIKKDAARVPKPGKEVDFGRIGFGQDIFAASMLAD